MDIIVSLLKAITSVNGPLTLIAFIVVALVAALMLVLRYTRGLDKIQDLIGAGNLIERGEFRQIYNTTLYVVLAISAMFFVLLAYNFYIDLEKIKPPEGIACFGESCTGLDANETGCAASARNLTKTIASYPKAGEKYKSIELELRHSDLCNSSWAKADAPLKSRLFMENDQGSQYKPLLIRDFGFSGPYYTDMVPGTVRRRSCIENLEGDKQCTSYVPGSQR